VKKLAEEEARVEAEAPPAPTERRQGIAELISSLRGGKIDPITAMLMMSELRRMDREDREERKAPSPITPEAIAYTIRDVLKDVLPAQPVRPPKEEMPEWAKDLQKQQQDILTRLTKTEEERRQEELMAKATEPLQTELEKEREERTRLAKQVEELSKQGKPKGEIETTRETLETLQKIDEMRGVSRESTVPAGATPEVAVASKTLGMGEKVITKGMGDMKETMSQFLDWQIEREKRAYRQVAPKLEELSPEEKLKVLQQAAGGKSTAQD